MSDHDPNPKQQVFEIKQGSLAIALLFLLCSSSFAVEHWFGKRWAIGAAIIATLSWFIIRPWQFGLLSPQTRRGIKVSGAVALCGFILVAVLSYWRYGNH